ncbi:MAG: hypothetical protein U0U67_10605 [Chitinophagales bacterium]
MPTVIHKPILPKYTESVRFYISLENADLVNLLSVELSEIVHTIDASGNITESQDAIKLYDWDSFSAKKITLNYKRNAYGRNKLISYTFTLNYTGRPNNIEKITVNFATIPYPVDSAPIPIYTVGHVDSITNIVFIPEKDMKDKIEDFPYYVSEIIKKAFFKERTLKSLSKYFNYFINPNYASYNNDTGLYAAPDKAELIEFCAGKIILHDLDYNDVSDRNYCVSEYYNFGTLLHELGHQLFFLSDEYKDDGSGAVDYHILDNYSNIWEDSYKASIVANPINRRVTKLKYGNDIYYKVCKSKCIMNDPSEKKVYAYDTVCSDRVKYVIHNRAYHNNMMLHILKTEDGNKKYTQENEPFRSDFIFKGTKQIRVQVDYKNNEFVIDKSSMVICPGNVPYLKGNNNMLYVNYLNQVGTCLNSYRLYAQESIIKKLNNAVQQNKTAGNISMSLLIPYNEEIKKIELFYKEQKIAALSLDFKEYRQLFV